MLNFKFINNEYSGALPNHEGALSTSVPSETIATANKRVTDELSDGKQSQRGHYLTLTPSFWTTV